jgi:hypothetical protein
MVKKWRLMYTCTYVAGDNRGKNKKYVAFGGTRTHANKVDYDLNVAP